MQFPFSFWKPQVPQGMYYFDTGSGLWNDASNWFTDMAYTISAGRTPINGDEVWVSSSFNDNTPTLSLVSYNGYGGSSAICTALLTVSGGVYVSAGIWGGNNIDGALGFFSGTGVMGSVPANGAQWTGSCEFHNSAYNDGQVGVYAYFYDTTYNGGNGSVFVPYFYDDSTNQGYFADAWFYNNSYNGSGFGGNSGQFYDYSINYGYFSMGTNSFHDYAQNDTSGACSGTTEFYGYSTNHASYLGYGVFYDNSGDFGSTYSGYYYNYSSTQVGNITGYGFWYDNAVNSGTNVYDAYFDGTSSNNGVCDINASFYGYSYNGGTVSGNGYFYSIAENAAMGTVVTNAEFYGSSKNYGTVNGDGYFYDSSDQFGTVLGVTTCSTSGTCP